MAAFLKYFTIAYFYLHDVRITASHLFSALSLILPLVAAGLNSCFFFSFGKWNTYKVSPSFLFLISSVPFFNCDPVTSYLFWRGGACGMFADMPSTSLFFACDWPAWLLKMDCKHRKIFENWIYWCSFSSVLSVSHWDESLML